MALACQRDSYLKNFKTKVKSCTAAKLKTVTNGKKATLEGFNIILDDTILFPEGGGQPDDRGTIDSVDVLRVVRQEADALHFVQSSLAPGSDVELNVNWSRRFDHMQQHTGQHLITAVTDSLYGYKTTSWNLAAIDKISFIELDTPEMTVDQMRRVEEDVNQRIRASLPVTPALYPDKHDPQLKQFRGLGLPDDHVGPVRVLTIQDTDAALCCGTHVSNLCHLQAIKLLSMEKGKKNKVNLYFLVGDRVLSYLGRSFDTERALTPLLNGPPEQHPELAEKLLKSYKQAQKSTVGLLREIAVNEARRFKSLPDRELLFSLHRKDGDNEFMNIVVNEIGDRNIVVFLTVGEEKGSGLFVVAGKDEFLNQVAPRVGELLEAKGACKNGRYQGKANKLINRKEVEKLLRENLQLSES